MFLRLVVLLPIFHNAVVKLAYLAIDIMRSGTRIASIIRVIVFWLANVACLGVTYSFALAVVWLLEQMQNLCPTIYLPNAELFHIQR